MVDAARKQLERLYDCTCYVISEVDAMDPDTGIMSKTASREGPLLVELAIKLSLQVKTLRLRNLVSPRYFSPLRR